MGIETFIEELRSANQSDQAKAGRALFRERRDAGSNAMYIWSCSDMRVMRPPGYAHLSSIATGGDRSQYSRLLSDPRYSGVVVLNHFARDLSLKNPGEVWIPEGCGGLDAKGRLLNGSGSEEAGALDGYIRGGVWHRDVVLQACSAASRTAQLTHLPVMAAAQNHLDGSVSPIAVYSDNGRAMKANFPLHLIQDGQYDPSELYVDGIPVLLESAVHDQFRQFLIDTRRYVGSLEPDLSTKHRIQDARIINLTTEIKAWEDRYPGIDRPFQATVPRELKQDGLLRPRQFTEALRQVEYPLSQAVLNIGSGRSFANAGTVLIETHDMGLSAAIAETMLDQHQIAREWVRQMDGHVIIASSISGELHDIAIFDTSTFKSK